jgi:hypothetical protein
MSITDYNTKGQLPSLVPLIAYTIDIEMQSSSSELGRLSSDSLLTLAEITFYLQFPHSFSFTAVIQDGCKGQGVSFG